MFKPLFWILIFVNLKIYSQNNDIFFGGIGGNFSTTQNVISNNHELFKSADGDGINASSFQQQFVLCMNQSGEGDSWAISTYDQGENLVSFLGNTGDGWSALSHLQVSDTSLFNSNNGDGWVSNFDLLVTDTSLFKSNDGDGWNTYQKNQKADTTLFRSGVGDGWVEHLVMIPSIPLPITLLKFEGKQEEHTDHLYWQTSLEINSSHFVIEHSIDGKKFTELGMINAKGNSSDVQSYYFINKNPFNGNNYYRLNLIDLDGKKQYSSTLLLVRSTAIQISIYPNPTAQWLNLNIVGEQEDQTFLNVFDINGKLVIEKLVTDQSYTLDTSILSNGKYILAIKNGNTIKTFKLVKVE